MYGLIALGLNLQYGVARILNLSYGEFFMGGAFFAFFTIMLWKLNPLLSLFVSMPIAFVMNWLIYQYLMHSPDPPFAGSGHARRRRRAGHLRPPVRVSRPGTPELERRACAVTPSFRCLCNWPGRRSRSIDCSRLLGACVLALALFLVLRHTRFGRALRAITIDPIAASLVGIDVRKILRPRVCGRRRTGCGVGHVCQHIHFVQRHDRGRVHVEGADRRDPGRCRPRDRHAGSRPSARRGRVGWRISDRLPP